MGKSRYVRTVSASGREGACRSMIELIAGAGVAGVVGSIHCIGMCGSFAVACGGTARESFFWHAGRLTTYMVLGALAGAFGGSIPGPGWVAGVVSTALIVYFAAVLAGLLPEPQVSIPGVQRAASRLISKPEAGARYLFGLVNGLLITRLKIDSFIVTLSMMFILMGLRSGISGGQPYSVPQSFTYLGQQGFSSIPHVFVIALLFLILMSHVFRNTVTGRHLLATGGNATAARMSGIDTDRMVVIANTLSGFFAALAAVLWASQLGSCAPETGDTWLIISFAVAIIGGTGLSGGVISAFGLLMGAAIFMLIKHGLVELKANPYSANAFLGPLILLAVVVDRLREVLSRKGRHKN